MKLVFFGTPEFGAVSLRRIVAAGEEVVSVVTQPDRPGGRGRVRLPPPVKVAALDEGIPILQPESPREPSFLKEVESHRPDLMCVVAYGHILRQELLNIPLLGSLGLHPSLLPKYRGAAPINWALIRGEKTTGLTTFFMNEAMDAGEIVLQKEVEIADGETAGELEQRLAETGADLLVDTLALIRTGQAARLPQDDFKATYAPKISKEDCLIAWNATAGEVRNLIHGLSPSPGAYTLFRGERLKVLRASVCSGHLVSSAPGDLLECGERLSVACRGGSLLLGELQPEGKRVMTSRDFVNGYRPKPGEKLG